MVTGLESFRRWFRGFEDQYVIIGGTACDILMAEAGCHISSEGRGTDSPADGGRCIQSFCNFVR